MERFSLADVLRSNFFVIGRKKYYMLIVPEFQDRQHKKQTKKIYTFHSSKKVKLPISTCAFTLTLRYRHDVGGEKLNFFEQKKVGFKFSVLSFRLVS